jgi:hypothetical protein
LKEYDTMKIEEYSFGSIRINGNVYSKDLWLINGKIEKRDKSIAKEKFETSHKICAKELKKIVTKKTKRVIIGSGASGLVTLTEKASKFLEDGDIKLQIYKTSDPVLKRIVICEDDSGIIHLTC